MTDLNLPALKKLCSEDKPDCTMCNGTGVVNCHHPSYDLDESCPACDNSKLHAAYQALNALPQLIETIERHELIQVEVTRINKELRGLLQEAFVKLEAQEHPPRNLIKRIDAVLWEK